MMVLSDDRGRREGSRLPSQHNRFKPLEVPRLESQSLLILLTVASSKAQSYFVYFLHGCPMNDGVR